MHRVYMVNFGTKGDGVVIWNNFVVKGSETNPIKKWLININKLKRVVEWTNVRDLEGSKLAATFLACKYKVMEAAFWVFSRPYCLTKASCHVNRSKEARDARQKKRMAIKKAVSNIN